MSLEILVSALSSDDVDIRRSAQWRLLIHCRNTPGDFQKIAELLIAELQKAVGSHSLDDTHILKTLRIMAAIGPIEAKQLVTADIYTALLGIVYQSPTLGATEDVLSTLQHLFNNGQATTFVRQKDRKNLSVLPIAHDARDLLAVVQRDLDRALVSENAVVEGPHQQAEDVWGYLKTGELLSALELIGSLLRSIVRPARAWSSEEQEAFTARVDLLLKQLNVPYSEVKVIYRHSPWQLSGAKFKVNESMITITVNTRLNEKRLFKSIVHEAGHTALHPQLFHVYIKWQRWHMTWIARWYEEWMVIQYTRQVLSDERTQDLRKLSAAAEAEAAAAGVRVPEFHETASDVLPGILHSRAHPETIKADLQPAYASILGAA